MRVLPSLRKQLPPHELGILIYDAHSTHIQRRAVAIAKWFGFLIVTLPSHLSITLQPLDNFFNGAFAKAYQEEYQAAWVTNRQPRAADKVCSVIKAFQAASQKQEECRNAWSRCGMAAGFPTPLKLSPSRFSAGEPYRDRDLQAISPQYLKVLFAEENLIRPPGDVISSVVLQKRSEKDASIRRLSNDLINMMAQRHPSENHLRSLNGSDNQQSRPNALLSSPGAAHACPHSRSLSLQWDCSIRSHSFLCRSDQSCCCPV